jgi:hypothetical protein
MRSVSAVVLAALLCAGPARAQSDFSGLNLRPGEVIFVTDSTGTSVSGPVSMISPSALRIGGYEFKPAPGLKIERRGDSLRNGTLIGLAVGVGIAAAVGGQGCTANECPKGAWLVAPVAGYGALGAFIDWRHEGRTVIYRAPQGGAALRVLPTITPDAKAIRFSLSF